LFGGQFTPPHQTGQDRRACLSTAAATQARQQLRLAAATLYATQNVNTLWSVAYVET